MYGYIYKTTNLINYKIYIGQHKSEKFDKSYYGSGKYLHNSINKYGIENFKVEIIKECFNKEELDFYEIYYIDYFNSRDKSIGYNITIGGYGCRGYKFTEEDKIKIGIKTRENNLSRDKSIYKKVSEKHLGKKMMTDGTEQRWVNGKDIDDMKLNGWYFGSCKKRNRDYFGTNNPMYGKSAATGKKWIHRYVDDKLERLYVLKEDLDNYLNSGYLLGMK